MRKYLFLLLIGCVGMHSGLACPSLSLDGKTVEAQKGNADNTSPTRPRAPRRSRTFQVSFEPGMNPIQVSSSTGVGIVTAVIENLSSGTIYTYSFDSSVPAFLPISGESGVWRVSLTTSSGTTMIYELDVY